MFFIFIIFLFPFGKKEESKLGEVVSSHSLFRKAGRKDLPKNEESGLKRFAHSLNRVFFYPLLFFFFLLAKTKSPGFVR